MGSFVIISNASLEGAVVGEGASAAVVGVAELCGALSVIFERRSVTPGSFVIISHTSLEGSVVGEGASTAVVDVAELCGAVSVILERRFATPGNFVIISNASLDGAVVGDGASTAVVVMSVLGSADLGARPGGTRSTSARGEPSIPEGVGVA